MATAFKFFEFGRHAFTGGGPQEALACYSLAIQHLPAGMPALASQLLRSRSDCWWELGNFDEAFADMEEAMKYDPNCEISFSAESTPHEEAMKWLHRGIEASNMENYHLSARCYTVILSFRHQGYKQCLATVCSCRASSYFMCGKVAEAKKDIIQCKKLDRNLAREQASYWMKLGMEIQKGRKYCKALQYFGLALAFSSQSAVDLQAHIHSHMASCHYQLEDYSGAVKAAKECHRLKPMRAKEEAIKWKERGNFLFKEKKLDVLVEYYSLAISYTPINSQDLLSQLLCNRSLAHIKNGTFKLALTDAKHCIKLRPEWSKGHYRLGSSLVGLKRPEEALDAFMDALAFTERDEEMHDTFSQFLLAAEQTKECPWNYDAPRNVIQKAVDDAVAKSDWCRLELIIVKLGLHCDCSNVPLEQVLKSGVEADTLLPELLDAGASPNGSPQCEKPPLLLALESGNLGAAGELVDYGADLACAFIAQSVDARRQLHEEDEGEFWHRVSRDALQDEDDERAEKTLQLLLMMAPRKAEDARSYGYKTLASIYFTWKNYSKCIECGKKLFSEHPQSSKDEAQTWKERGNELFKNKRFDEVVECYSLALMFAPAGDAELRSALLSNRCAAFSSLQNFRKALDDAQSCVAVRPQWSKGYYRLGTCLNSLGRTDRALKAFCEGFNTAECGDSDQVSLATQMLALAKDRKDGTSSISCKFSQTLLKKLVKDACAKQDWPMLHLLFLGGDGNRAFAKGRGGLATGFMATAVPIRAVLESKFSERDKLIRVLLDHGASPNGTTAGGSRSPLEFCLEKEDYAMAGVLLKHGADSRCLGTEPAPFENKARHFKDLAVRAVNSKQYERAIELLNVALHFDPGSASTSEFQHQVHSLLAAAYFGGRRYAEAADCGHKCFKIKPTKSQVEANRWKDRGKKLFTEKNYGVLVEYYTLAIKYAPSADKDFLATLLCNRALVHYNLSNYRAGLDDAKSCTRFRPSWFKGYVRQGYCYACLGQDRDAVRAFGEGLRTAENDEDQFVILTQLVGLGEKLEDGTSSVHNSVPPALVERLLRQLVEKKDWHKVWVLYLGGGGPRHLPLGEGGLATGRSAAAVPLELIVSSDFVKRHRLIVALLENGGLVDGVGRARKPPLALAVEAEDYRLAAILIQHNADPSCLQGSKSDSPLIEAMRLAITKGVYGFLRALLESECCDADAVDANGNTLFHHAVFGKCSRRKCDVLELLTEVGGNPVVKNKEGKLPIDYLTKKDPRAKLMRAAASAGGAKTKKSKKKKKPGKNPSDPKHGKDGGEETGEGDLLCGGEQELETEISREEGEKKEKKVASSTSSHRGPKTGIHGSIEAAIEGIVLDNVLAQAYENDDDAVLEDGAVLMSTGGEDSIEARAAVLEQPIDLDEDEDDYEEGDEADGLAELELDSPFENLPWEVDCTDQFWKTLQSPKVSVAVKRRLVTKIRMLAGGRWTKKLCKRLEGLPKKHGILLFEARLTRHARIIWELTVAFSARCSEDPELRVQSGQTGGRVYSEIIRVWDVSGSHEALGPKIERIVKSHDRGLNCIVKKELHAFKKHTNIDSPSAERLPGFFVEVSETVGNNNTFQENSAVGARSKVDGGLQLFVPPASPHNMEYHILKFYSFSSALINSILQGNHSSKVDFPFRVTELEHAIINLQPKPPRSVILLGRSGTGKTTCCLYRLWSEFQTYWEKAKTAGPHIPKLAQFHYSHTCPDIQETCEESSSAENGAVATEVDGGDAEDVFEFVRAEDARLKDLENDAEVAEGEETVDYEHLHQVFITKNAVLCSEVKKNFTELSRANSAAQLEDNPIPTRIQEIRESDWPLFINSRDWFLLLDASLPGKPFFPRTEDGSLVRRMLGWGEEDTLLAEIEDDFDSEDEGAMATNRLEAEDFAARGDHKTIDPRREVTYFVFSNELWPKMMRKTKLQCHPTLVWTEIRSFIKGSAEALHSDNGYLTLGEYLEVGRKRAPNFSSDREAVYELFQTYQNVKASLGMFDEADVVCNLYSRLQNLQVPEWSIHRIYVDETQDFTQAELLLLIRSSRDPNGLFFTGDTAQSIMRGISFRFSDLKSLFFHVQSAYQALGFQSGIRVPNKLYQLTHNYRSHAGILRLASSVVDLLLHYFPDSFDKLERDQGLFEGPKPVLLDSCSFGDLAMILRGNRRQSSRIEFGAHQVVLVASEDSRASLPEELRQGLVMTIYESKGLEFDDVLIYNFFKDSQAQKEWRVVAQYVKTLEENKTGQTGLVELTDDELQVKTRPLTFDSERHKVLNSELKYLYTAITRARVNVWFFDEDEASRAPIFEYFQRLGLVRVVRMSGSAGDPEPLTSMFVEKSTTAEWREQGGYFYSKRLWEVAIKCFTMAGDELMARKSHAQLQAAEAGKLRSRPKEMRTQFLGAAEQFLQCAMVAEAAVCLYNARERVLLAKLNKRLGNFEDAAKLFRKEQKFREASECFEMVSDYCQAVESLCQGGLYEDAIDTVERYNSLATSVTSGDGVQSPKPSRTVERLCHQLAEEHYRHNRRGEMVAVLSRLPSAEDRIAFLENHGCVSEAADALIDRGRDVDAAHLLRKNGQFLEAAKLCSDNAFAAECFLAIARSSIGGISSLEFEDLFVGPLERALELFSDCRDSNGAAECLLLLGDLRRDTRALDGARVSFYHANNVWGEIDACIALLRRHPDRLPADIPLWTFLKALARLFNLVLALHRPKNSVAEQKSVELCEKHLGLCESEGTRYVFTRSGTRFASLGLLTAAEQQQERAVLEVKVARKRMSMQLCRLALEITKDLRGHLRLPTSVCKRYQVGLPCASEECRLLHCSQTKEHFEHSLDVVCDTIHLNAIVSKFTVAFERYDTTKVCARLLARELAEFQDCRQLCDLLFPQSGPPVFLTRESLRPVRRHQALKERLEHFATKAWKSVPQERRWCNADAFILLSEVLRVISAPNKVGVLLSVEEKAFQKKNVSSDGMTQDKERGGVFSFFRLLEHGRKLLYVYGDVLNSAHFTVRRFLSLPAWRRSVTLPALSNVARLLELHLTSCLALFARLFVDYEDPVCLPENYMATVKFSDGNDCAKFTLSTAVDATARGLPPYKGIRQVQKLLEYMVRLLCGKIGHHFSVIPSAFTAGSLKHVMSGEAERFLVLALTMLCNCGRGIPNSCAPVLLDCLRGVSVHELLPRRVQVALHSIEEVYNTHDAVLLLKGLLDQRKEKLFKLHWKNRSLLLDEHFDFASFQQSLHSGPAFTRPGSTGAAAAPVDPIEFDLSSEFQMPAGYAEELVREHALAEEEAERELAAVKIQRWFRHNLLHRECDKRGTAEDQQTALPRFDQFKVDDSACGICGIHFAKKLEADGTHGEGARIHTRDTHLAPDSPHWQMAEEFHKYKRIYVERVHPLNVTAAEVMRNLDAPAWAPMRTQSSHDFGLDLQRLGNARARVGEFVRHIESRCNWGGLTAGLEQAIVAFASTVKEVQRLLIEETHGDDRGASGRSRAPGGAEEMYGDDELMELPAAKDRGSRGGRRPGKRTRGRRRRNKKDFRQS